MRRINMTEIAKQFKEKGWQYQIMHFKNGSPITSTLFVDLNGKALTFTAKVAPGDQFNRKIALKILFGRFYKAIGELNV